MNTRNESAQHSKEIPVDFKNELVQEKRWNMFLCFLLAFSAVIAAIGGDGPWRALNILLVFCWVASGVVSARRASRIERS